MNGLFAGVLMVFPSHSPLMTCSTADVFCGSQSSADPTVVKVLLTMTLLVLSPRSVTSPKPPVIDESGRNVLSAM